MAKRADRESVFTTSGQETEQIYSGARERKLSLGPKNRRRDRDAEGVEGERYGEGYAPPHPPRGSGGAPWATAAVSGEEPWRKRNLVHSDAPRRPL